MAIPNPNPNIADGLKCDNKTYSSNKIESLIKVATELPIPEEGDAGKVLTVNDDLGYDLETAPGDRLPETALADAGKVVTVNAAGTGYELDTPAAPTSIIDDSASSASTVYSSDKVDELIGIKPISKTDFFATGTAADFDIFQIGKLIIVNRLSFTGITCSQYDPIATINSAYKPNTNSLRALATYPDGLNIMQITTNGFISEKALSNQNVLLNAFCYTIA